MASPLRSLTSNWKLKILAFALALLLWVAVSAEQVTSDWIPVTLQVVVGNDDYLVRPASVPDGVEVQFSGTGRELWDLAIRRPPLRLTIPQVSDTIQSFSLDPRMVRVPSELNVFPNDVRPGAVRLRFTRIGSRDVPVRIDVGQRLPAGWTLVEPLRAVPAAVRVTGPFAQISQVRVVATRPVPLFPTDSVFARSVALDTAGFDQIELSAARVVVSGRVERVMERTLRDVPVSVGAGIGVRPEAVAVQVRGAQSLVQPLLAEALRVVVAIDSIPTRIPADGTAVPLRIEGLPRGIVAQAEPRTVRLFPEAVIPDSLAPLVKDSARAESR